MKFSYPEDCKMISEKAQQNCRANRSGLVVNSKPVKVLECPVILVGFFHQLLTKSSCDERKVLVNVLIWRR